MRINARTLTAAVFTIALLAASAGCKKKTPVATAPPPSASAPRDTTPPPPPPSPSAARINSFTAEPRSIERGQSATLRWSVANATDMSLDQGLGSVAANATRQVFPSNTTTYTLTASSTGGSDTRSVTVEVVAPPAPPPPPPASRGPVVSGTDMLTREAQDALFDYDKAELREEGRQAMTKNAELLKRIFAADPSFSVAIEGHCDERGSAEYNLGLGDRRATAAKEFLVQLGVPADRMTTISFGKDRPVCTDENEACYQRNRRAHLSPAK